MPGAPLLIWSNGTPLRGLGLLDRQPVRDVVGRDEVERRRRRGPPTARRGRPAGGAAAR